MPKLSLKAKKERVLLILDTLKKVFPNPVTELDFTKDYELLFAVIMSAQTTDVQVNKMTSKLYKKYPTLESYLVADLTEFTKDISSIGLYKNKAKNVLAAAKMLVLDFDGKVPREFDKLILIPGAARKTANVIQRELFGVSDGIAVDTHVIRLSQQLGLTKYTEATKIEQDLIKITPADEFGNISILLILYGRRFWKARQQDQGILSTSLALKN
jgi:endonuclease III